MESKLSQYPASVFSSWISIVVVDTVVVVAAVVVDGVPAQPGTVVILDKAGNVSFLTLISHASCPTTPPITLFIQSPDIKNGARG